jgi:hypothetical protein
MFGFKKSDSRKKKQKWDSSLLHFLPVLKTGFSLDFKFSSRVLLFTALAKSVSTRLWGLALIEAITINLSLRSMVLSIQGVV